MVVYSDTLAAGSDWTRLEVGYTNPAEGYRSISCRLLSDTAGTVYMDCAQLEKTVTASRHNLLENGDFNTAGSPFANWTAAGLSSTDGQVVKTAATATLSGYVFQVTGDPNTQKRLSQTVTVSGSEGDCFVLTGWAKGDSAPLEAFDTRDRAFSLMATFTTADGESEAQKVDFNPDTDSAASWQYASAPIIAPADYTAVTVTVAYDYNVNTMLFDGIQLYKEEFGASYTYDDEGNVISIVDLQKQETKYEFDGDNNLTKEMLPSGAVYTYDYDSWHNVTQATSAEGMVYEFVYDDWGNNTQVFITGTDGKKISTTATYSTDGNLLVSTTDALGKETKYGYNAETNLLEWVQYPGDTDGTGGTEDTRTKYTYDTMLRMLTATADTDTDATLSASYTYTDDKLTALASGSSTYNFSYGAFGSRTGISIGSRNLASYTYSDTFDELLTLDYGNGDKVQYIYDSFGRQISQSYEDGASVSYLYNNESVLAAVTDSETGTTTRYYYDFLGRPVRYTETAESFKHSVQNTYNADNNLESLEEIINGTKYTTSYAYDDDNRLVSVTSGNTTETYAYDAYGRLTSQTTKQGETTVVTETYTYTDTGANATSSQIATLTTIAGGVITTYTYSYDDNGNILSISDGTNTTSYVYDSANQLTRENNQAGDYTHTWTYDNAGNILSRSEYAYTTGELGTALDTVTYTYGDENWGDLLTAYDGTTIETDAIGNMTDDGTWEYTWKHGRQLASMSDGTTTWDFTYNVDGLRTRKTNGTTTYNYVYSGTTLTHLTVGNDTLHFGYGADGRPMTVTYNGTEYYYITNLQGDVIAIADSTGTRVVNYSYDAWGNPLSTTGSMASTLGIVNPLRYRGYVYDIETGLYYVSSRYYDPEIGRFINADSIDVLTATTMGLTDKNLVAYCDNNPVVRADRSGEFWDYVIDIGFIAWSVADVINEPDDWKNWLGLVIDVGFAVAPFVPSGVSQIIKAGDKVSDGLKVLEKVTVVGETMDRVKDFAKGVGALDNLYDGFKFYSEWASKGALGKIFAEIGGKLSNLTWLLNKLRTGYTVYDIGIDIERITRSSSYLLEKTTLFLWEYRNVWKSIIKIFLKD